MLPARYDDDDDDIFAEDLISVKTFTFNIIVNVIHSKTMDDNGKSLHFSYVSHN